MLDIGQRFIIRLLILPLLYEFSNSQNLGIGMYYMNYTAGQRYNFSVFKYKYYSVDNKIVVYVEFELYEGGNFTAHVKLDMLRANNKKMNLLNMEQDGCKVLNGVHSSRLLKIIASGIIRVVNLPAKCPLLTNKLYIVNNYTLEGESLPSFIPPLHWVIQTKFVVNKKYLGYMILQGNIFKPKTDSTKFKT